MFSWNDTNGNWAADGNWGGGTAPTGADSTDVLIFGNTQGEIYTATNDVAGTFLLNQIILNNTAGAVARTNAGNQVQFAGSTPLLQQLGGAFQVRNDLDLATDTTIVGGGTGTLTLNGVISGTGALVKSNASVVVLRNANTYSGGTAVKSGVLEIINTVGSATGSGSVTVSSGGQVRGSGAIAGDVFVNNGGALRGSLSVGDLTINSGGNFSPGVNLPDTLNAGDTTWNGGGIYYWDINDFSGTAGSNAGWDLLNITGNLTINSAPGNAFIINLTSAGSFPNFVTNNYSLAIATVTGDILGFAANKFQLNSGGFSDPGRGTWTIERAGSSVVLLYNAIPEPGTVLMWSLGLGILAVHRIALRRKSAVVVH